MSRKYYSENKEHCISKSRNYYLLNKEKVKRWRKRYNEANKTKISVSAKRRYEQNKPRILKIQNLYQKQRCKIDPSYKLAVRMRSYVCNLLKERNISKPTSTFKLIGCTKENLKLHLEKQFKQGMKWENYGEWHVDHIKPCASFDLTIFEEQQRCFHYSNLQPLWATDNIKKSDKYL